MTETIEQVQASDTTKAPSWVMAWADTLTDARLSEIVPHPERAAVISTDMLVGFCSVGPLSSPRVGAIAQPVAALFQLAHDHGVRRFVLSEDVHHPEAAEFGAWPAHCVRGTEESQTIPELAELPFAGDFVKFEKNSLSLAHVNEFDQWLDANDDLESVIVVGNCTDLCVYTLAMHVRTWANEHNKKPFEVIVPENAVQTFDLSEQAAAEIGTMPHPGDFFHWVFLYHMAMNDIRVVRKLT